MGVQGLSLVRFHLEAGQTKTCAPEPPAGRFPKFLLPRAAGRPQKLKFDLCIPSPTLLRVVGGEWSLEVPAGISNFPGLHMADWYAPGYANWQQGHHNNPYLKIHTLVRLVDFVKIAVFCHILEPNI